MNKRNSILLVLLSISSLWVLYRVIVGAPRANIDEAYTRKTVYLIEVLLSCSGILMEDCDFQGNVESAHLPDDLVFDRGVSGWNGPYIKPIPSYEHDTNRGDVTFYDGWGNPLMFSVLDSHIECLSSGRDSVIGTEDDIRGRLTRGDGSITIGGHLRGAGVIQKAP